MERIAQASLFRTQEEPNRLQRSIPLIKRKYWIPVIGYYLNYFDTPVEKRRKTFPVILAIFIIGYLLEPFTVSFNIIIPLALAISISILIDAILFFVLVLIAIIETTWVMNSKNPQSKRFQELGWSQLYGLPRRTIFRIFIYFNYQEIVIAMTGLTYLFVLHAFV